MKLSAAILAAFASPSGKLTFNFNQKCNQNYMIILEANVSCTNGKQLFEATCDANGFVIKINQEGAIIFPWIIHDDIILCLLGSKKSVHWTRQSDDTWLKACRAEGFAGIDFPNSFVWGDSSITKLVNPACGTACTYADVVSTGDGTETCSQVKPVTGLTDGDSAATHSWSVPFNQCGVTGTFDDTSNQWKYDLYFNSNSSKFQFYFYFTNNLH